MVVHASAALIAAVSSIVAQQMANTLMTSKVDLSDDEEVARLLSLSGFGSASICALMRRAAAIARRSRPPTGGLVQ